VHVAVHVLFVQNGRAGDEQSAPVLHSTQTLFETLQNGVAPPQLALLRHCTHWPLTGLHCGVAGGH
jgi:hypothetical protein